MRVRSLFTTLSISILPITPPVTLVIAYRRSSHICRAFAASEVYSEIE